VQELDEQELNFPEMILSVVVEVALMETVEAAWLHRLVLEICLHVQELL
jgi:hypothetical protein